MSVCVHTIVNILTCLSFFPYSVKNTNSHGELAQLARASALQAEGQGFESPILHYQNLVNGTVAQLVRAPL